MAKSQKELAFLRELEINDAWTNRFTDLVDKYVDLTGDDNLLYINAGTGNHCLALREKVGKDTAIFATCETEDLLNIARDKALAIKADVDFSMLHFEDGSFDSVIADASFVRPSGLEDLFANAVRVTRTGGKVAVMIVSSGSFGEVFSMLWEVLFNEDLGRGGAEAEDLIRELPTASRAEDIARAAGVVDTELHSTNEVFEFDNGPDFVSSPLVADFLLPQWLRSLPEADRVRVTEKLAETVDAEDGTMTFRFSVKALLLTGKKA